MPILRTLFSAKEMMGRCMMLRELAIQTFVKSARQMKTHISSLTGHMPYRPYTSIGTLIVPSGIKWHLSLISSEILPPYLFIII